MAIIVYNSNKDSNVEKFVLDFDSNSIDIAIYNHDSVLVTELSFLDKDYFVKHLTVATELHNEIEIVPDVDSFNYGFIRALKVSYVEYNDRLKIDFDSFIMEVENDYFKQLIEIITQ